MISPRCRPTRQIKRFLRKASIAPTYVGSSTTTVSPGCRNAVAVRLVACCAPVVTMIWSSRVGRPERVRNAAMPRRSAGTPSGK